MGKKQFNENRSFRFKRFARKSYAAFNSLNKAVTIGVVVGSVLTVAHTTRATAQNVDIQQHPGLMEKELDEVMVTASRAETPLNEVAKTITVITKDQIARTPAQSIEDLLIYVAGVDVMQRGPHGVQADISVRGGTANQTAILLNGINLTNSQTGHYSFDLPINLSDIERIEIIHGSSSLIYGASAFAGGINIITKKDVDTHGYIRTGAGGHQLYEIETRGAVEAGITSNTLSFSYKTSDGYIPNSDYDLYNALWQTWVHLQDESKLDFQLGYNNKHYGANTFYSAAYPNQYERIDTYLGTVRGTFGSTLKVIPALYWTRHHDRFDLIKNQKTGQNHHRNDMYGGSLNLQYKWKWGMTSFGSELRRDEILSSNLGKSSRNHGAYYTKYDSRTNTSFAAEHSARVEQLTISAGLMANYSSNEDAWRYLPGVSASYSPDLHFKLHTSWSKGMRQPTFTDLYYKAPTHSGNDSLRTECSENLELGFKYRNNFMSVYITGYLMWGKNMIDWVQHENSTVWESCNLLKVDKQGVEMGLKFNLYRIWSGFGENTMLSFDYVRQHQKRNAIDEGVNESSFVFDYLRDKFTVSLNYELFKNFDMGWYFRMQKRMGGYKKYQNGTLDQQLTDYPFYSILDVKLNYRLNDFNFNLSINNLYDRHYFDRGNIPQPGFWMMGGVSYLFN